VLDVIHPLCLHFGFAGRCLPLSDNLNYSPKGVHRLVAAQIQTVLL
jgi:hypothetical protein